MGGGSTQLNLVSPKMVHWHRCIVQIVGQTHCSIFVGDAGIWGEQFVWICGENGTDGVGVGRKVSVRATASGRVDCRCCDVVTQRICAKCRHLARWIGSFEWLKILIEPRMTREIVGEGQYACIGESTLGSIEISWFS